MTINSLSMRIAATFLAVALPVVAFLVGVTGAEGAPAARHAAGHSTVAASRDSAVYQPIGFRWAQNLRLRPAFETDRFVGYYESMADVSGTVLARDSVTVR